MKGKRKMATLDDDFRVALRPGGQLKCVDPTRICHQSRIGFDF